MVINGQRYKSSKKTNIKPIIISIIGLIIICFAIIWHYSGNTNVGPDNPDPNINTDDTVYISLPNANKITALVDDYSQPDSIWSLVSKTASISTDYIPTNLMIASVETNGAKSDEERSIRSDIDQPLSNLFGAASTAGYDLMIGSGYRSANLQSTYYNGSVAAYGEDVANQSVAKPGQSEHQLGLAVDVSLTSRECYIDTCFGDTSAGQWLAANSYKYGFILRYPADKVSITGYQYEPWHFRYVGIDLATALHESNLTLDEAWTYLQTAEAALKAKGSI